MLTVTHLKGSLGGYQPQLLGEFGDAGVELQQKLRELATVANYPAGDPGRVDGVIDDQTIGAMLSWLDQIPGMSSTVKAAIIAIRYAAFALLPAAALNTLKSIVTTYGNYVIPGIQYLIDRFRGKAPAPPNLPPPPTATTATTATTPYYTRSAKTAQYVIYTPLAGFASFGLPLVELGNTCSMDGWGNHWCGPAFAGFAGFSDFGQTPGVSVSSTAPTPGTQVSNEQFLQILAAAGISADQAREWLGISPWYLDWKFLVPIGVGVVALGVGGYYLLRRKKD